MATITRFEDLISWQKARLLENKIFKIFEEGKPSKDFKLKNQINASSGSIMDNIAEGFERGGNIEFINFLSIAKGSSGEVRSQLYRSLDRGYLTKEVFEELYQLANEVTKLLASFMEYLNNSELKGLKFKDRIAKKNT